MKKKLIFINILLSFFSFSQSNSVNLLIDNRFLIEKKDNSGAEGVFECVLEIRDKDLVNRFSFILNSMDDKKCFEDIGQIKNVDIEKLTTIDDLNKMTTCEIHDLFSLKNIFLYRKNDKNEYLTWTAVYIGTSRNVYINKQKNKI